VNAVYYEGGGRFRLGSCEPQPPAAGEVRLAVHYCGICGTDLHIAHGHMDQRVRAPQVIGHEMSGRIDELGPAVEGLRVGQPVVVRPLDARGETPEDRGFSHIARALKFMGIDSPGAFQSSWTVPAFSIHPLPDEIDMRLAALVEPLAVACHDVRRGQLRPGEAAVVIGGGPIGTLIALVARQLGARVLVSEPSAVRREFASELGLQTADPGGTDVAAGVADWTDGIGADVVFEVSGSAAGAELMTRLSALRGRVVVVAIFAEAPPVRLFDFFWKELQMLGARVYEREDYDRAIELVASGALPLDRLVTAVEPLERLPALFEELKQSPRGMKFLIDCQS
jgi:2-desacetyl-2-hydroxyethyl bacteriochlorophyllide A dehydrogenase